ncbi:MAG TPA: hypothetical protein VGV92_04420 [Gammaproteobacteria bacterium]|nr:hypothetical protein [Gammaproteobacteria bacterium]
MANEQTPLNPARTRNSMFCDLSLPTAVLSGAAFVTTFGHFLVSSKVEPNVAATVFLALGIGFSAVTFALSASRAIVNCCKPG